MKRLRTLAAGLAVALALAGVAASQPLALSSRAQVLVDAISGDPSKVVCDLGKGEFGFTLLGLEEIHVERFVCSRINALAADPRAVADLPDGSRTLFRTALALSILVHESWHLANHPDYGSEPWADCREIQTSWAFAEFLGADHATAVRLGLIGVQIHYLKVMINADYEDLVMCRPGGPWDLHPETAAWPIG